MAFTGPRLQYAEQLVTQLQATLIAVADTAKVHVTMNPEEVASGATNGVVMVALPVLTSPNFAQLDVKWEVHVIAGPATNWLVAWDRIDTILQVLFDGQLNIASADPANFAGLNGAPLPAYTLTLNE